MKNGKPNGCGLLITKGGGIVQGYFVDGVPSIYARIINPDGSYYEGGIREDKKHGHGKYVDIHGTSTESNWKEDVADGETTIKSKNDIVIFKGTLKDMKREGQGIYYNTKPKQKYIYTGEFKDDKYHGKGEKAYDNGEIVKATFVDGKEEGMALLHKIDGTQWKVNYVKGKKMGNGTQLEAHELITFQ